jgi:hypothetical protein
VRRQLRNNTRSRRHHHQRNNNSNNNNNQHHRQCSCDTSFTTMKSCRRGLSYVLTVDMNIYQRIIQEMGDSHRLPCGMYYCCHVTEGGNHVDIGVAVAILLFILLLVAVGMIAWGIE